MTIPLYRTDAYSSAAEAKVIGVTPEGGVLLDRTIFYPQGGGQPGDVGTLRRPDGCESGSRTPSTARTGRPSCIRSKASASPTPGETVGLAPRLADALDPRMRIHTALHLLSVVLPYPVTGGSIGDGEGRLDFDIPEAGLDKAEITEKLNALVARDAA